MTVISSEKDADTLSLTITAEFDADPARVWQLWSDPRQLERWWGPPTYPATFERHEPEIGGRSSYFMTGPEGDRHHGWWSITAVDEPTRFEFDDGFANDAGEPLDDGMVTHAVVTLDGIDHGRTRMVIRSTFPSAEVLEQMVEMGMEEGMRQALGQADAILAESRS